MDRLAANADDLAERVSVAMQRLSDQKTSDRSPYPIHLAFGHEQLAACIALTRSKDDLFTLTHRNIHYNFALSNPSDWDSIADESSVTSVGINKGHFGCMTMRNRKAGVVYTTSILGNNISVGLGASSCLEDHGVCWIQTGDGAIEEGAFYESLLFASARNLKVIFVLENNNWSLGTSIHERRRSIDASMLCASVNIEYVEIMKEVTTRQLLEKLHDARVRALKGPILIEAHLVTRGGHYDTARGYVSYHHGPVQFTHDV